MCVVCVCVCVCVCVSLIPNKIFMYTLKQLQITHCDNKQHYWGGVGGGETGRLRHKDRQAGRQTDRPTETEVLECQPLQ